MLFNKAAALTPRRSDVNLGDALPQGVALLKKCPQEGSSVSGALFPRFTSRGPIIRAVLLLLAAHIETGGREVKIVVHVVGWHEPLPTDLCEATEQLRLELGDLPGPNANLKEAVSTRPTATKDDAKGDENCGASLEPKPSRTFG
ncbi:MAG: hypothetical protein SGJ19_18140 [Planctomycetia bacterium]|nr:hypothetical protein [Planctomycetia bacterium]